MNRVLQRTARVRKKTLAACAKPTPGLVVLCLLCAGVAAPDPGTSEKGVASRAMELPTQRRCCRPCNDGHANTLAHVPAGETLLLAQRAAITNWDAFAAGNGITGWQAGTSYCGWTGIVCGSSGDVTEL
jgi:hypothetical protein